MACHCEIPESKTKKRRRGKSWNVAAGTLVLLMPKCAMCWTAYLSLLGWAGVSALAYRPWFVPVAVILFCMTLGRLFWRALSTRQFLPFTLASLAALLVAWEKMTAEGAWLTLPAMVLMIAAWIADTGSHFIRRSGV